MDILGEYAFLVPVILVYATMCFFIAFLRKRNDVADVAWGLGFLLVALLVGYKHGFSSPSGNLVDVLVFVWAVRLSLHIYLRNRTKGEDYRYKAWRDAWGRWFYLRSFLQVFVLQGMLLLVVAAPIVFANAYYLPVSAMTMLGVAVWALGFMFETVGDLQLTKFIAAPDNKGKILQTGLWAYSRHPNYFGEVTLWWGIWLIAFQFPSGVWSILGPLTISFLILKVSGVPLLENKMVGNPDFEAYRKRVSMFIPLPPKKV